jgi:hypothetical protein
MERIRTISPDASSHVLRKWRLIGCYWVVQAVFVLGVGGVWYSANQITWRRSIAAYADPDFWSGVVPIIGAIMALQCAMVWPVRRPRARRERGWPLWLSVGAAALVGTALAAGAALGLEVLAHMRRWEWPTDQGFAWAAGAWCVLSYAIGAMLMYRFCVRGLDRGQRHESLVARIAATLFLGTVIEMLAIIPLDVMLRRKNDCYSLASSWWAYTLLIPAGLVTLGPAIFLPLLARRRKRWYAGRCDCCGYDMTGLLGTDRVIDRCPECGAGWRKGGGAGG